MFSNRRRESPLIIEEELLFKHQRPRLRLRFLLGLLIALATASWALTVRASVDSTSSAASLNEGEPQAGQLILSNSTEPALMLGSKVHFDISGLVAHVTVEQQFRNDSMDWVEAVYVFPLPEDATVNHMRMKVGDRIIEGKIAEKAEAEKRYQAAKSARKKASLVKQQRPNMFTSKVANIGPYETLTVTLNYVQTVKYDQGRFSLRFPMTITPRYIPGKPLANLINENENENDALTLSSVSGALGWAINTDQVPDASDITPFLNSIAASVERPINPIEISVRLAMGMPLNHINSAYHPITIDSQKDHYAIELTAGQVTMDQDFLLSWQPVVGHSPRAALFSESVAGDDYGLLMVVPPTSKASENIQTLPKESIYVIDTSGSMGGVSIRQARESLLFALQQLTPNDRFNVIAFNTNTHQLFANARVANTANLTAARQYVNRLQAGGGTEMRAAINAALQNSSDESHVRQVIFITDGAVGNEEALFNIIFQRLGNSRLFTVGIGSAPNSYFMRKAAEFGRGSFTYIGNESEVHHRMEELFAKIKRPLASNIHIDWPQQNDEQSDSESYPQRLPDLYQGQPLLAAVKLKDIRGELIVKGKLAGKNWVQKITVEQVNQHRGIATLWARQKIDSLLDRKMTGAREQDIRRQVLNVALTHQLMSPYTSFIAIEQQPSRSIDQPISTKPVLNARPEGQSPQSFAYPKTAAGLHFGLIWGTAFLAIFACFFYLMRRDEHANLCA